LGSLPLPKPTKLMDKGAFLLLTFFIFNTFTYCVSKLLAVETLNDSDAWLEFVDSEQNRKESYVYMYGHSKSN
jgi:hypothetical protein